MSRKSEIPAEQVPQDQGPKEQIPAEKASAENIPHVFFSPDKLPVHVGIIMDGNGRWAVSRNLPRTSGHREGLKAAKRIVKAGSDMGLRFITLYVFSTENWKRAAEEVSFLMRLIKTHLKKEYAFYVKNSIRVLHSGNLKGLPEDVQREIITVSEATAAFNGLTVNLAINYGGRDEIVRAVERAFIAGERRPFSGEIIESHLDNPEIPDADLIIRTGGERRISNFLLWESAYAELYFSDFPWPDWTREHLEAALADYIKRQRRFGDAR